MNQKQKKNLLAIVCILILLSGASALVLYALKQNINLFYTPTQFIQAQLTPQKNFRLGGYVKKHSVHFDSSGQTVSFIITDFHHDLMIHFSGVLPNLFREGQGVVITGKLNSAQAIIANQVLAKHDEKYMPPSIAKELQARGSA